MTTRAPGAAAVVLPGVEITLSYSPYRVWITDPWDLKAPPLAVSLSKNNQLRMGARNQALVRAAKRQMADDSRNLMTQTSWPEMRLPLVMDAEITTRTRATKDDDGVWTALYRVRDAMAESLGIDDTDIRTGTVTWVKGTPEATRITLRGAL